MRAGDRRGTWLTWALVATVGFWGDACNSRPHNRDQVPSPGESPRPALLVANPETASPPDSSGDPPAALRCLARFYVGRPARQSGEWTLEVPGGRALAWKDGRTKTFDQMLAEPDLSDMFAARYRKGPLGDANEDPGRVRVEELFMATYGATRAAVERELVKIQIHRRSVRVHRRAQAAFLTVAERLETLARADPEIGPLITDLGGTFAWRTIAGTARMSPHAFGIAIDLNPGRSRYWRWGGGHSGQREGKALQAIVDAFEENGFIWGGRWHHFDTMHFEYRPELLDHACYPE